MIVVDTSAVVEVLVGESASAELVERLGFAGELHAPHLLDFEFIAVLRRLVAAELISAERANDARVDLADLNIFRYPLGRQLADLVWKYRHALGAYDAAFVALAEALGIPLITTDRHLGASHGHNATIETYPMNVGP